MLEIIILVILSKRIGNIAQAKGLAPGRYKALLVVMWFLGEITGLFGFKALDSAMHIPHSSETMVLVIMAAAGAIIGAVVAFFVARNAKSVLDEDEVRELSAMAGV